MFEKLSARNKEFKDFVLIILDLYSKFKGFHGDFDRVVGFVHETTESTPKKKNTRRSPSKGVNFSTYKPKKKNKVKKK